MRRILIATVVSVGLFGCPSDETSDDDDITRSCADDGTCSPEEALDLLHATICDKQLECDLGAYNQESTIPACRAALARDPLHRALLARGYTLSAENTIRCRRALLDAQCHDFISYEYFGPCGFLVNGTASLSDPCDHPAACAPGGRCDFSEGCPATCIESILCGADADCGADASCDKTQFECAARAAEGEPCFGASSCQGGLVCEDTTRKCVPFMAPGPGPGDGETCGPTGECQDGLFCDPTVRCRPRAAGKEDCIVWSNSCEAGFHCKGRTGSTCWAQVDCDTGRCCDELGGATCRDVETCATPTGRCVPGDILGTPQNRVALEGDRCPQATGHCGLGLTCLQSASGPTCRRAPQVGQSCEGDPTSAFPVVCKTGACDLVSQTCQLVLQPGAACPGDELCADGLCVDMTCEAQSLCSP